jgi:hypothetical protein
MRFKIAITALPERMQSFEAEATSSMEARREVLGREMVATALARKGEAGLIISVLKKKEVGL